MSERVPFNRVDTLIYHFDQMSDIWSIHFEVRVEEYWTRAASPLPRSRRSGATRWVAPGWNPSAPRHAPSIG